MKLPYDLICAALTKRFECETERVEGTVFEVGRPLLWSPGERVVAGYLYVSETADAALDRDDIFTVYVGKAESTHTYRCASVNASAAQVLNFLQQFFDRYDDWARKLDTLALNQSNLREILSAAREVLANPITVIDEDFSPIAQVGENALPPELQMYNEESDGPDAFSVLKTDINYIKHCNESKPFLCSDTPLGRQFLSSLIGGLPMMYRILLIEGNSPLRPGDGALLAYILPYVRAALSRDRSITRSDDRLRELLMQVLTGNVSDYSELSERFSELGWKEEHAYFCLVLRLMRRENQGLSVGQICARLKRRYPQCCPLPDHGLIVCYFNATAGQKSLEDVASELTVFIRDGLMNAGYSRSMQGLSFLKRQMIQAEAALDLGARRSPHKWIHHFNSISMEFLLKEATNRLPGDMLCHPGLLALRAYDAENGTEYMHTLRVYLRQNLNAVRSARELFIHRSTFLYRLSRICEILGSTLENPEELTYLSVSFLLIEKADK